MANKICFTNQKGGVGKTASAQQLIAYLVEKGKKVLAIDLDAQWNLTLMFGLYSPDYEAEGEMSGQTVYQLFKGKPIEEVIVKAQGADFICGSVLMANADGEFAGLSGFIKLKNALKRVEDNYDYIIIDCPPTCGLVTVNALVCSDGIIIPYKADSLTKAGIIQLSEIIKSVRETFNPTLQIYGVLVTMYDKRANISKKAVLDAEEVAEFLETKVFDTKIRQSAKMRELASEQNNIYNFAPGSPSAIDYNDFCNEFVKEIEK